jgi:DNA-binding PadR family transcriptional regulator
MNDDQLNRELTTLEFVILGFFAIRPQSGYDIMNYLETGMYRLSASTGSVYPVLKRLEKAGLIKSHLEQVYETRPRKVYSLLPAGAAVLDRFLRAAPTLVEVIEEYDIAMHKFLIMEFRLSHAEIVDWLRSYENVIQNALNVRAAIEAATRTHIGMSRHAQFVNESILLEIQARLTWVRAVLSRVDEDYHHA